MGISQKFSEIIFFFENQASLTLYTYRTVTSYQILEKTSELWTLSGEPRVRKFQLYNCTGSSGAGIQK